MRKYLKIEKILIAANIGDNYTTYDCVNCGIFQLPEKHNDGICPTCKTKCNPLENVTYLREKFKKELNFK